MGGKSVLSSGSEVAEIGAGAGLKEKRDWGRMLEGMQEIASYKVTQMLGASTMVKLISLMLFSVFLVIAGGALIKYNQEGLGWGESLFKAYALLNNAPGTSAVDEADEVSSLIVNAIYIIGILTFATALGVITSSMELALERILADDHKIIEKNHILVLNWNEMVPPMVRQIAAAIGDGVAPHCPIVILADKDQKQMKDALDAALPPGHRLELMIRSGNPGTLSGLEKVSAGLARFVVVLTPEGRGGTPEDLHPLRALLTTQAACLRSLQRRRQPKTNVGALPEDIHVVVTAPYQEGAQGLFRYCFYQQRNLQQRVLALSTLQPGLARVHEEIFDQEKGCQLYLHPAARWPWILNSTFAEASQHFPSAVLLGWVTAGPAPKVTINPPAEQPIPEGSEVMLLDRQREVQCHRFPMLHAPFPPGRQHRHGLRGALRQESKRMLVLNFRGHLDLLRTLDDHAHAGSTITVVASDPKTEIPKGVHVRFVLKHGSALSLQDLRGLEAEAYACVIILSTAALGYSEEESDAMVLTSASLLMSLRRRSPLPLPNMHLLAAMQDPASMPLLKATCSWGGVVPDTVFANELESGCIVQVLWAPHLQVIYEDFLDVGGGELSLVEAGLFAPPGTRLSFNTLAQLVLERGAVALGLMKARSGRLQLSPDKAEELALEAGDRVALFGEVRA